MKENNRKSKLQVLAADGVGDMRRGRQLAAPFELVSKKTGKFSNGGHKAASCMAEVGEFQRKSKTDQCQGGLLRLLTSDQKRQKDGKEKVTFFDLEIRGESRQCCITEALEAAVCMVFLTENVGFVGSGATYLKPPALKKQRQDCKLQASLIYRQVAK